MNILIAAAVLLIAMMAAYVAWLWAKVFGRRKAHQRVQAERRANIAESVDIIAMAMQQGQCNLSEGVLRIKPLLEVLETDFSAYPAMNGLYQVVAEMPILEERKRLKRNERMKLDLIRESSEAKWEAQILAEAGRVREAVKAFLAA